jgi:hypothetical protein
MHSGGLNIYFEPEQNHSRSRTSSTHPSAFEAPISSFLQKTYRPDGNTEQSNTHQRLLTSTAIKQATVSFPCTELKEKKWQRLISPSLATPPAEAGACSPASIARQCFPEVPSEQVLEVHNALPDFRHRPTQLVLLLLQLGQLGNPPLQLLEREPLFTVLCHVRRPQFP